MKKLGIIWKLLFSKYYEVILPKKNVSVFSHWYNMPSNTRLINIHCNILNHAMAEEDKLYFKKTQAAAEEKLMKEVNEILKSSEKK